MCIRDSIPADTVTCAGKRLKKKSAEKQYFMFYKPRGVITSMKAQDDRSVVSDLIHNIKGRVYPVGRLDRDSEGFLILTDDGEFSQRLSHPSHHIAKTYRVTIKGDVPDSALNQMREGIEPVSYTHLEFLRVPALGTKEKN